MRSKIVFLFFVVASCLTLGSAQTTKVDLGTQTKGQLDLGAATPRITGQLPVANANLVLSTAAAAAQAAAASTFTNGLALLPKTGTISGSNVGVSADLNKGTNIGFEETFYTDATGCNNNTPTGFTSGTGAACFQGTFAPITAGTTFNLVRGLHYSGGPALPQASVFAVAFQTAFDGRSNQNAVGFNAAAQGATDSTKSLDVTVTSGGFGLKQGSANEVLWPTSFGPPSIGIIQGSTDAGTGDGPWSPPQTGQYDVGFLVVGDGTCVVSAMHTFGVSNSASFRVPCTTPPCPSPCGVLGMAAGVQNFEVSGAAFDDRIGPIAETDGILFHISNYLVPHLSGQLGFGLYLRWSMHADGTECKYDGTDSGCSNVWAFVPPSYDVHGLTRWVVMMHGYGENGVLSIYDINRLPLSSSGNVADRLYQQGYVIVSLDNTVQNCYGSPQCVADLAHAVTLVKSYLSLAPQPFLMADSMGGDQMLNAVAYGVVSPPAMIGFSINTSLYWEAVTNGQMPFVATGFGFPSGCVQGAWCNSSPGYAAATSGYDALATAQAVCNPSVSPVTATCALQARLATVPTLLLADPTDPTVDTNANSTAYFAAVNALRAGTVRADFTHGGGHVGTPEMVGSEVVGFFNQF